MPVLPFIYLPSAYLLSHPPGSIPAQAILASAPRDSRAHRQGKLFLAGRTEGSRLVTKPAVLVTGAASGIGAAVAGKLRTAGWLVAGFDLSPSATDLSCTGDVP